VDTGGEALGWWKIPEGRHLGGGRYRRGGVWVDIEGGMKGGAYRVNP